MNVEISLGPDARSWRIEVVGTEHELCCLADTSNHPYCQGRPSLWFDLFGGAAQLIWLRCPNGWLYIHKAFVESKAKRMSLPGRVAETLADVDAELGILADAVVQDHANIHREMFSKQSGGVSKGQFYNTAITMEDWFLFSQLIFAMLHYQAKKRLADKSVQASLLDTVPYRVLSFEAAKHWVGALNTGTMEHVLGTTNMHKGWA